MSKSLKISLAGILLAGIGLLAAGCSNQQEQAERPRQETRQNEGGIPHPPPHHDVRPK